MFSLHALANRMLTRISTLAEVHTSELEDSPAMYMGIIDDRIYGLTTCSVIDMGTRMQLTSTRTDWRS